MGPLIHSIAFGETGNIWPDLFNCPCAIFTKHSRPFRNNDIHRADHPIDGIQSRSVDLHQQLSRTWLRYALRSDDLGPIRRAFDEQSFLSHHGRGHCILRFTLPPSSFVFIRAIRNVCLVAMFPPGLAQCGGLYALCMYVLMTRLLRKVSSMVFRNHAYPILVV